MPSVNIDSLTFDFPDGWHVLKYDDWTYYRKKFQQDGVKAVDILAVSPGNTLWIIEAKDFRKHARSKDREPIHKEIQRKVIDTLAALLPATIHADDGVELEIVKKAIHCQKINIVFQCEQPTRPSKLFPVSINTADLKQKFRALFRGIDPNPRIFNMAVAGLPWIVR